MVEQLRFLSIHFRINKHKFQKSIVLWNLIKHYIQPKGIVFEILNDLNIIN